MKRLKRRQRILWGAFGGILFWFFANLGVIYATNRYDNGGMVFGLGNLYDNDDSVYSRADNGETLRYVNTIFHTIKASRAPTRSQIEEEIILVFGDSGRDWALRVVYCESRFDSLAFNVSSGASGIFQYIRSTWRGSWNPYREESIWDASAQIRATRLAFEMGKYSWWECK